MRSPQAVLVGIGKPGTTAMAEILTKIGKVEDVDVKKARLEILKKVGKVRNFDKNRPG